MFNSYLTTISFLCIPAVCIYTHLFTKVMIPVSSISYLSVLSLINLGGELEAREGVARGQLVVER